MILHFEETVIGAGRCPNAPLLPRPLRGEGRVRGSHIGRRCPSAPFGNLRIYANAGRKEEFRETQSFSRSFCFRAGGDFAKAALVFLVVRAHQAIPEIEVEAVVAADFFVVHRVRRRCVDKVAQEPGIDKAPVIIFVAGVPDHIEEHLPDHEDTEG